MSKLDPPQIPDDASGLEVGTRIAGRYSGRRSSRSKPPGWTEPSGLWGEMLSGGGYRRPWEARRIGTEWRKESAMKANVGDWLVIKGTTTGRSDQRGLITEVHSADGSPPYVVRWLATGHVATVVPGPDAVVVTPEEQEAADERAQERAAHRGTND
jgi:hypothetical protein